MRDAAELISEVFRKRPCQASTGVTELDLAAKIEYGMKQRAPAVLPSIRSWLRATFRMGARATHVQTAEEKRIGRPRPGCYTSRLLQRYDPHRFPGTGTQNGSEALSAPSWRLSKRPRQRSGPASRLGTVDAARRRS